MASEPRFSYDDKRSYVIAPGNIITGNNLEYLLNCLNSEIMYFALRKFYMGGGIEGELKTNRLEALPVPAPFTISQGEDFNQALMQKLELSEEEVEFLEGR